MRSTSRSLANLYIKLEQFNCSILAETTWIWTIRSDKELHNTPEIGFPHQKCWTSKCFAAQNLISFNFCGSVSVFGHVCTILVSFNFCGSINMFGNVCTELQRLQWEVVGRKKHFFWKVSIWAANWNFWVFFPGGFMKYQKFLSSSRQKVSWGYNCATSPVFSRYRSEWAKSSDFRVSQWNRICMAIC